jgi:paraquat-inducible protein B
MPDNPPTEAAVPAAEIIPKKRLPFSSVWLVPLIAALAGGWIAVTKIIEEGPKIEISFTSAEGLEVNKTKVEYNGLDVGTLTGIKLAEDHRHVIGTVRMSLKVKNLLVKDTQFWVVKPRISGLNITGLGTLVSGNYIGMQLGQSAESERRFVALENPPATGDMPGQVFSLKTKSLGSLGIGTPVLFRQLPVGHVVSYELDHTNDNKLTVKIFVQSPYDCLVTPDTFFWQASGIDIALSANGLHVQAESVMSILAGGIAFDSFPTSATPTNTTAVTNMDFTLFNSRTEASSRDSTNAQIYALNFDQTTRGLEEGAPVELGGVTIGEVRKIEKQQFDVETRKFSAKVTICVDPQRYGVEFIGAANTHGTKGHPNAMDDLLKRGLRAQLKTGNVLSGSLLVGLDFFTNEPAATQDWTQTGPLPLPTEASASVALGDKVSDLLDNANRLVADARHSLDNLDLVLLSADQQLGTNSPLIRQLEQTIADTRISITNANQLINHANNLIDPNSALTLELDELLRQGAGAARSLRELEDYLEQHPEALLRGKTGAAKP